MRNFIYCLSATLLVLNPFKIWCDVAARQPMEITITGKILKQSDGKYKPVPGVKIVPFREGPILDKALYSDKQGNFQFVTRVGRPFMILAVSADGSLVPDRTQLMAANTAQSVSFTLLTTDDYEQSIKDGLIKLQLNDYLRILKESLPDKMEPERELIKKVKVNE